MDSNVLYGDIFVIPNSLQICDDNGLYGYAVEDVNGLQVCFEGWITNDECDNWSCHHYDKIGDNFSNKIPVELFMGKKEGDTVNMTIHGKQVVVTCRQKEYRYSKNAFENVLYNLTKSFGGVCASSYFSPPLCERSQMAMILSTHEKYARSLNMPIVEPNTFNYSKSYINQCKNDGIQRPRLSLTEILALKIENE